MNEVMVSLSIHLVITSISYLTIIVASFINGFVTISLDLSF